MPISWGPDLVQENNRIFNDMIARVDCEEVNKRLGATEYERDPKSLKRILTKLSYDLEASLIHWREWVQFRHENNVDSITNDQIKHELAEGILSWRGHNKENMPCIVVTGRFLDPVNRFGTPLSFKRYIIKTIEGQMETMTMQEEEHEQLPPSSSSLIRENDNGEEIEKIEEKQKSAERGAKFGAKGRDDTGENGKKGG